MTEPDSDPQAAIDPSDFHSLAQIILAARERLPNEVWDFVVGGAGSETTLRHNRRALDSLAFRPDQLRDVTRVDARSSLCGHPLNLPVVLAPMGSIALIDPSGALGAARAAEACGTLAFFSGVADPGPEIVCAKTQCPLVFTIYAQGDQRWLDETLEKIKSLRFAAVALLTDNAYYGFRDRDSLNKLRSKVTRKSYARLQREMRANQPDGAGESSASQLQELDPVLNTARLTWETVRYVKHRTGLPVFVKGIDSAKSANLALDHGADVIYVSNTGGRQLDHLPGTASVLPEIVEAVAGRGEVVVDGGFMRGADVLKGIALGAKAVGIGRLQALALGAGGAPLLHRALELLEEEIVTGMGLLGVTRIDELNPDHVRAIASIGSTHPLGPFPAVMEKLGLH